MLRQLAQYHAKDSNALFMVRLAQGLTHLGKGTLTLQPYHSERQLMNPVAVAGLLSTVVACLDVKNSESIISFVISLFSAIHRIPPPSIFFLHSSHLEQVALPALHVGRFPPAADAHYLRRGAQTAACLCASGTGR